jgi:hypothetical protein
MTDKPSFVMPGSGKSLAECISAKNRRGGLLIVFFDQCIRNHSLE